MFSRVTQASCFIFLFMNTFSHSPIVFGTTLHGLACERAFWPTNSFPRWDIMGRKRACPIYLEPALHMHLKFHKRYLPIFQHQQHHHTWWVLKQSRHPKKTLRDKWVFQHALRSHVFNFHMHTLMLKRVSVVVSFPCHLFSLTCIHQGNPRWWWNNKNNAKTTSVLCQTKTTEDAWVWGKRPMNCRGATILHSAYGKCLRIHLLTNNTFPWIST